MKKNLGLFASFLFLLVSLISCDNGTDTPEVIVKESINGFVQKGPFNVGTSIILSELTQDFTPTGKNFTTQITDNNGSFEFAHIELVSQYVTLQANGFYFNELAGKNSAAQLTLFALADIADKSSLNVNVLTHLEKPRVEYLISHGSSFAAAKDTALAEILRIFNITKSGIKSADQLNITEGGDDNGILLAISSILQGFRTEAELSEVLNAIANDIKEDGVLNNDEIKSSLAGQSQYINSSVIRQNLEEKYNLLGETFQIPEFEKYITQFNENTDYIPTSLINYPKTTDWGSNILHELNSVFYNSFDSTFCMAAETKVGIELKIEMKFLEGAAPLAGYWGYANNAINWTASSYNFENNSQIFTVIEPGKPSKLKIKFYSAGEFKFQINYYEGGDKITRSRIVSIKTK